jgi:hypothetical protein
MKSIEGLDYRSIGLFRIFLGLVVLYNMATLKWGNFNAFFSVENGFIPEPVRQQFIFQNLLTSDQSVILLFLLVGILAISLAIGYAARYAALFLFLFYAFYNATFSHISFGYDRYLEVLLFLSIFLPLEQRFGVTSNASRRPLKSSFNQWPAFLVLLQIGFIYTISGLAKNGIMWQNGTAVGALLLDDLLTLPLAVQLSSKTGLVKFLSYSTILFEAVALFLLFSPWKNQTCRIVFCVMILSFHWGLSFFVDVGHFKLMGILAVILVLPISFWQKFKALESKFTFVEKAITSKWYRLKLEKIPKQNWLKNGLAFIVIYLIVIGNLRMISVQGDAMGKWMQQVKLDKAFTLLSIKQIQSFGTVFNQNWYFYAPNPNIHLGDIYFIGVKYNGIQVNLETSQPFIPGDYINKKNSTALSRFFHTKLRNQINKQKNADMCLDYARYLVNKWEQEQKEYLKGMEGYNFYFNGRKMTQGEAKTVKIENIISVDLDKMRRTN